VVSILYVVCYNVSNVGGVWCETHTLLFQFINLPKNTLLVICMQAIYSFHSVF